MTNTEFKEALGKLVNQAGKEGVEPRFITTQLIACGVTVAQLTKAPKEDVEFIMFQCISIMCE